MARKAFCRERLHGGFQQHHPRVFLQGAADRVGFGGDFFAEVVGVDAGGVDGLLSVDVEPRGVGRDGGGELECRGGRV